MRRDAAILNDFLSQLAASSVHQIPRVHLTLILRYGNEFPKLSLLSNKQNKLHTPNRIRPPTFIKSQLWLGNFQPDEIWKFRVKISITVMKI